MSIPNKTTLHISLVDFVGFQRFALHKERKTKFMPNIERKQMNMQNYSMKMANLTRKSPVGECGTVPCNWLGMASSVSTG
jgi:hypothetical protein